MENPIYSGYFTSTGASQQINFRPGVNWMWVYNYTQIAGAANVGVQYYWQAGMPVGGGLVLTTSATGSNWTALAAGAGFTPFDSSIVTALPPQGVALTGISAANPPVVLTATPPPVGSIVRLSNLTSGGGVGLGQQQISGVDFTVTAINAGVSFTIGNINLVNSTASTAGFWRLISSDPEFYPRIRTISWITASGLGTVPLGSTRIYTTVTHQYIPGQKINLSLPGGTAVWGNFFGLNNQVVTIIAVNTARNGNEPTNGGVANNFDVAFDSSNYGAWNTFPHNAPGGTQAYLANTNYPQGEAVCIPFGEDTAFAIYNNPPVPLPPIGGLPIYNVLADSVDNVSSVGIILAGGAGSPGGAAADLMFWTAGSSFDSFPQVANPTTP